MPQVQYVRSPSSGRRASRSPARAGVTHARYGAPRDHSTFDSNSVYHTRDLTRYCIDVIAIPSHRHTTSRRITKVTAASAELGAICDPQGVGESRHVLRHCHPSPSLQTASMLPSAGTLLSLSSRPLSSIARPMQSTLIVSTSCNPVLPRVQRSAPPAVRRESSSGLALPTEPASLWGCPKGLPPPLDCNRARPTRRPRRAIARRSSRPAGSTHAHMPRSHRSPSTSPGTAAGAAEPGAPIMRRGSPTCNQGAYQRRNQGAPITPRGSPAT